MDRSINADTRQNFDSKYPLIRSKYKNWIAPTFQTTFHYDAHYWINDQGYNLPAGETGFDGQESKLPTYWNTSFSKICLGMKINQQLRFIVIYKQADSLHSLIADGQYCASQWVVRSGKSWLVPKPHFRTTATKKGSMSFVVRTKILKPELVLLATAGLSVTRATQGSDLAQAWQFKHVR